MISKRISVTGPESTGKSVLSQKLAKELDLAWVPEVSRSFLAQLNRPYLETDLFEILQEQMHLERETLIHFPQGFIADTDPLVIEVWSEFKYGRVDAKIKSAVQQHQYDFYLVLDIDIPWEEDPLRENPEQRAELLELYLAKCRKYNFPHALISGTGSARLQNAHRAVRHLFDS